MNKEIVINYWWTDENDSDTIDEKFQAELEEMAMDRIKYLLTEGYVEGQLVGEIDDKSFNGYVTIKKNSN